MRNFLWRFVLVAGIAILTPAIAAAQSCQMHSYSDMWLDESGNAVAVNYTDASACGSYTAYADVTLTMPSGYSVSATASASCCAQAVSTASAMGETGEASVTGSNEVISACGTLFGTSVLPPIYIGGAYTKEVWNGGQFEGWCSVNIACSNTSTPQCFSYEVYVGQNGSCSPAWNSYFATYKIGLFGPVHCVKIGLSLPTSDTSAEWCTPAQ
jgi:hypothetical protein